VSTPYLQEQYVALAAVWERRFAELIPDAGILFVSVTAHPEMGGVPKVMTINLGLERRLGEDTGLALIKHYMAEELASGTFEIRAAVYRGLPGRAARAHDGASRASS
jgi:hypothetical protein